MAMEILTAPTKQIPALYDAMTNHFMAGQRSMILSGFEITTPAVGDPMMGIQPGRLIIEGVMGYLEAPSVLMFPTVTTETTYRLIARLSDSGTPVITGSVGAMGYKVTHPNCYLDFILASAFLTNEMLSIATFKLGASGLIEFNLDEGSFAKYALGDRERGVAVRTSQSVNMSLAGIATDVLFPLANNTGLNFPATRQQANKYFVDVDTSTVTKSNQVKIKKPGLYRVTVAGSAIQVRHSFGVPEEYEIAIMINNPGVVNPNRPPSAINKLTIVKDMPVTSRQAFNSEAVVYLAMGDVLTVALINSTLSAYNTSASLENVCANIEFLGYTGGLSW